jgi:hypothetical protein
MTSLLACELLELIACLARLWPFHREARYRVRPAPVPVRVTRVTRVW